MAFSGLHVVCGFAGALGVNRTVQPILSSIRWARDPASGTPTDIAAPGCGSELG